jgi:ATP-binding cassette subfamily B protein
MGGMISAWRSMGQDPSVLKQKVKPGTARRMLAFAAPYTGLLAVFLLVVIVDASITIVNPLLYRQIINNGILKGNAPLIIHLAIIVGCLGLFDGALGIAQTFLSSKIGAEIVLSLRNRLFRHIQQMPLAFFTRTQTGALVSRLNTDVQGARTAFTDILSNVVGNLITVLLILGAMFVLSWRITLGALVLLPIFVLPAHFWGRKLQAITRERLDLAGKMNNLMVERFNVAGALLSKLFGRPEEDARIFGEKAARVSGITIKVAIYSRLFFTALIVVATVASALAYGWGGVLAVHHVLDVGTVVALTAYLARLYSPLVGLSNVQVNVMTALVSFERVFEVLDLPPMIRESPQAIPIPPGPATIEFDHVAFRYPSAAEVSLASLESVAVPDKRPQNTVLHDISFRVAPGQLVALVGPSGAGKTTITHLVPRLYDAQSGAVRIGGTDVRELQLDSLNRRIGIVTQDAHLFHDTIRANLLYARPEATEEQIRSALKDAQILDLIENLPDKLDTLVGERGYRFSGGEKQRIAIARLLLKAPDIVMLSSPTRLRRVADGMNGDRGTLSWSH